MKLKGNKRAVSQRKSRRNSKHKKILDEISILENVIALMPGHVYWKDSNGVLLGCNDEQARDIGLKSRHEVLGLTPHDTLPKELADAVTSIDAEVIRTGNSETIQEILILPNGQRTI